MQNSSCIVVKYGGNAMINPELRLKVLTEILDARKKGYDIVIVHGGGPFIQQLLDQQQIASHFVDGHRFTDQDNLPWIQMALRGKVNGELVSIINTLGPTAVGLCAKDGKIIDCERLPDQPSGNPGLVGQIRSVNTVLLQQLLRMNYIPVLTCIGQDASGQDLNINADLLAGHIAGALKAHALWMLTDVDGLYENLNVKESFIADLDAMRLKELRQSSSIQGGMIPKLQACEIALEMGAKEARILNGTQPNQLHRLCQNQTLSIGTRITP